MALTTLRNRERFFWVDGVLHIMSSKIPANAFHVAFDTKSMPGLIVAVEVQLTKRIGRMQDVFRLNLCEHPLYPALRTYCLANDPSTPVGKSE